MKIGIIGAGFIAQQHIRAWKYLGVEVILFGGKGAQQMGVHLEVEVVDALDQLLAKTDAVDICAPTDVHVRYALLAAAAGRHVICEKPLALSPVEAQEVVAACNAAEVRLFVSHVVRYFPEYETATTAVKSGSVGIPAVIRLARESFLPQRSTNHWLFDEEKSGGIIGDLMSHDIDYAVSLAGPVARAYARTMRAGNTLIDDHAYVVLTHRGGALSHLTSSWSQIAPRFRTRIEIAGSSGMLSYDSDFARTLDHQFRSADEITEQAAGLPDGATALSATNPFVEQLRDVASSIESGLNARVSTDDAVHVVSVIKAARESARSRQAVEIK